ncbi:hypothetical protein ACEUCJ_15115 [Aeromonas rivipollensis]|uniref:hypothetical protein n=1 Tax=Aeromonas rivipollensis TaxID=948519 RepID=UPI0038D20971
MEFLKNLFGVGKVAESAVAASTATVIDSLGEAGDKLFTSDEERAYWAATLEKVRQQPQLLQGAISLVMAKSPSLFISGARAVMLYTLAVIAFYNLAVRDLLILTLDLQHAPPPSISVEMLLKFIGGMFGMVN